MGQRKRGERRAMSWYKNRDLQAVALLVSIELAMALTALNALAEEARSKTHAVLLSFIPSEFDADESPAARFTRLGEIADAIDSASPSLGDRARLISLAHHESHFARYVDLDWPECRDGTTRKCDRGRAFGLLQGHRMTRNETRAEQMAIGLARLKSSGNFCKGQGFSEESGAFSMYATGKICSWPGAHSRVKLARQIVGRL